MIKRTEIFLGVVLACLLVWLAYDIKTEIAQKATQEETAYIEHGLESDEALPSQYDARLYGRKPSVKNQGELGTCWAVAATSALEAAFLPEQEMIFSADHISLQNYFSKGQNDGGDYTMVMAYLAGWQGPVMEADDPYGDGESRADLAPVMHVQEMQVIRDKEYEAIKRAVYNHGAVQTSIYMDLKNAFASSVYYNQLEYSYLYDGTETANHDVLIIGWDDYYSADRFNRDTAEDGAFICQNSWGSQFGEDGIFYVSYADVNIGSRAIAYTAMEGTDNFDNLYETDLCGWVGQLGYGDGKCFFSNVYTANGDETLEAIGFYAGGKDTRYTIYVIPEFEDTASFLKMMPAQSGRMAQGGYYTVRLQSPVELTAGQRYAVVVEIETPGALYPVATEYAADETTENADISDGEGYISHGGTIWTRTEEEHACNVCLKAYTNDRE